MERLDGTLACCNGHCCDTLGDDACSSSHSAGPQTPSIAEKTNAISRDSNTAGVGDVCSDRKRKLVLHVDVRNTILVSDSATHDNVEQALNSFLTGVTWGRQESTGWVWYSDRPSLRAPCPDVITYYKSRERELVRSPADRVKLRRITSDFTRQPIGRKFRKHFDAHLRLLEWGVATSREALNNFNCDKPDSTITSFIHNSPTRTKPEVDLVDRKLTIVGANGRLYHYLLPSFIKMMYDLEADGCHFSVILRTYGVDAPKVLDSIGHIVAGNHPLFPGRLSINVNKQPGHIRRLPGGRVRCELPPTADGTGLSPPIILETDTDIYRYLSGVEGVCGFVDDFEHWQAHDYAHSEGKPLWIDLTDPHVQHIFFDDNIRVADAEGIVDVRLFDGDCSSTSGSGCRAAARSLSIEEIAPLENVCLVQADLLESMSNVDYFINKARQCAANYSDCLRQRKRPEMHCQEGDISSVQLQQFVDGDNLKFVEDSRVALCASF